MIRDIDLKRQHSYGHVDWFGNDREQAGVELLETKINEIIQVLNALTYHQDRMIGCETLDIPKSYKNLHKAVKSANVKLAGKYDVAVDALLRIKQQKMRLIENEERVGLLLDVFDIAEKALEKIAEK